MIPAVMPTYARVDVAFEKGEGAYLFDQDGRRYLDFGAGIAVISLGHCHPRIVEALREQAGKIWHTSNLYRILGQERLAQRLVDHSFADSVFFCNSGAEAMECSLKMARKYHDETGNPDRYRVVACTNSFHGRTMATIAAAGQEKLLKGFGPAVEGFDHVAFGNLNETRAAITDETAAILVEPVQGEGGMLPASADYLRGLRQTADEFGLLLIFDEVQCGIGRTGKLFAHEWAGVEPDILAAAKGLGGGFPVGACLANEKAASALVAGSHGSTFGGNPLAMAVAGSVLDVILEDGFLERVQAIAKGFRGRLETVAKAHPTVLTEVRGKGLMLGLKCEVPNTTLSAKLFENGLVTVVAGDNVVRILPPLIIDESHVEEAVGILEASCAELSKGA
ncbi:MAG TPA: aspartate aminotransferase family protein [Rhodospirillales bacterium]|nr:aspartate aminotransferase family protein [Rhodospirillales bacterium]